MRYPGAGEDSLRGVSLAIDPGERVVLLGPSGAGKSTLLRALSGLVPHFHGGRFAGRVVVAGRDTRETRPAELAGTVATVFQDPEDQVVMGTVEHEVAFGPGNLGVPPAAIAERVEESLAAVDALHLLGRRTTELSGGELQRVCLASALALRPQLLLLDEPTSQLDEEGAAAFLEAVDRLGIALVLSEHRVRRSLQIADRALFLEGGRLRADGPVDRVEAWLRDERDGYLDGPGPLEPALAAESSEVLLELDDVGFSYGAVPVLESVSLAVRAGEVVALEGPNGSGKTTLAKLAAGLLEPSCGRVGRAGTACYLSQDPGRYVARERVLDEVALSVGGDLAAAHEALELVDLGWAADRHPRDLSSGERERLGLAAVVAPRPRILLLDEPTRGVDPERKRALAGLLSAYAARGNAVLVATHDRELPAHRRVRLGAGEAVHA